MLSERAANFLLDDLCARLGFCLPPEERKRLLEAHPACAEDFAAAVVAAEGMEIEAMDQALLRQMRSLVAAAFCQ